MPMILLSKGAEILLVQFHEPKGDRVGARPGERLTEDAFRKPRPMSPGVDFDGATAVAAGRQPDPEGGRGVTPHPGRATTTSTSGPATGRARASLRPDRFAL